MNPRSPFFVARLEFNAKTRVVSRRPDLASKGLSSDQSIEFAGTLAAKKCPIQLRRIGYRGPETGKGCVFLTNNFKLVVKTITDIYKARWQVELFFKWKKQNLKIKSFIGAGEDAAMNQTWIALRIYLLVTFIKFQSKLKKSMQQILRVLLLNLFERRGLMVSLRGDLPQEKRIAIIQIALLCM